jgi:glutathione S-transferase
MGIEFEDIMHEKTPQNSIDAAFNLGFPMVEDGDVKVHDSIAIMNYLCRKYNKLELLGLTPQSFVPLHLCRQKCNKS